MVCGLVWCHCEQTVGEKKKNKTKQPRASSFIIKGDVKESSFAGLPVPGGRAWVGEGESWSTSTTTTSTFLSNEQLFIWSTSTHIHTHHVHLVDRHYITVNTSRRNYLGWRSTGFYFKILKKIQTFTGGFT